MKRMLPFAPLLLLAAMLLSPAAALAGAKQGLDIWWTRVFPALLPSFLSVRTAQNMGLLSGSSRRPRGRLAAVVGFSLVSGAPNGAKLLQGTVKSGALSPREGEMLLPLVNSVSPAFLLSIIASELLKNKALFLPMAAAFYGSILCPLAAALLKRGASSESAPPETSILPFPQALSAAVESSMLDMLRIGGCILFACTLLALCAPLFPTGPAAAALAACLEVSAGAAAITSLSLPLRLKASLLTGAAAFGGLSLALQTLCCYPELKLLPYLAKKLALGATAGLCCYLLFPLFPHLSAAFAPRQQVLSRSLSLSALILSSALSAGFVAVLSLMISPRKRP